MNTVLEALNAALLRAFAADPAVILLGEDVLDPYGGAFRVTRGLSTAFPGRVFTTPISEAGLVGVAAGMALRGLRPVVEIMFGDFLTLAADQLINHAAKFRWMYNDQVRVPMVVRTPMGGRRGYGPTHSQSLEKHFLGVPGLITLAPCSLGDPGALLEAAVLQTEDPLLFVEHKLLYLLPVLDIHHQEDLVIEETVSPTGPGGVTPVYRLSLPGTPPPTLTLAAYGYMAELARLAQVRLAYEHEVFAELVIPTCLSPFDLQVMAASAGRTGRVLVVEEGGLSLGWGAEVAARLAEALRARLRAVRRLAAADLPIPASAPLEAALLPGVEEIISAALALVC